MPSWLSTDTGLAIQTLLYQVVAEQLETFLAGQQARDRTVPGFVEREFRDYLTCGVLAARGFIRVRCGSCGHERLFLFPAVVAVGALLVEEDEWRRRPRISSTTSSRLSLSGSGCFRFHLRCATAWPTTPVC